ncbi:MAG: CinA family nicotinamide mononucleotide deamidase-related protein [Anaerolineales bacterium]|nr:CinA family nicotinamide mononucleotide deamidase-related protein [Anaerolineales bacterium]
MPSAEIISIGTELLLGEIVDTNTRFIARTVRDLGIDLYRTQTIGDNVERIADAIRAALQRADIIITTGGLGPTVDDPTRQAVALAAGLELEFREDLWQQVIARMARYGRTAGENQKRQAYAPTGAIGIENPVGTAPCFIVETEDSAIIVLPGVPCEMEQILQQTILPYLRERFQLDQVIKVRLLHTAGGGESLIDELIEDYETHTNPTVGLAAHAGTVDIRISAKAKDEAEADRMIDNVDREMRSLLGEMIFGTDEETLAGVVLGMLERRQWTLSAVEAGTGGAFKLMLGAAGTPAFKAGVEIPAPSGSLQPAAADHHLRLGADITAGIMVKRKGKQITVEIILITTTGTLTYNRLYGGPPITAPLWAANLALNHLRLYLLEANGKK